MNINLKHNEKIIHELHPDSSLLLLWIFTRCLTIMFFIFWFSIMFYTVTGSFSELIQGQMGNGFVTPGVLLKSFTKFSEGVLIFVIIAFGIVIMYHHYLRKTYVYYITNQRCVFQGGIIKKIRRSIPYNKITDVEISQNIAEGLLGIASINIHTASMGTHKSEISFVGLKDAETPLTDINSNMESGGYGGN